MFCFFVISSGFNRDFLSDGTTTGSSNSNLIDFNTELPGGQGNSSSGSSSLPPLHGFHPSGGPRPKIEPEYVNGDIEATAGRTGGGGGNRDPFDMSECSTVT